MGSRFRKSSRFSLVIVILYPGIMPTRDNISVVKVEKTANFSFQQKKYRRYLIFFQEQGKWDQGSGNGVSW
jgi:hypothetical protein